MILPEVLIQGGFKNLNKVKSSQLKKALLPCSSSNVTVSPQAQVMRIIKRIVNKGICCSNAPSMQTMPLMLPILTLITLNVCQGIPVSGVSESFPYRLHSICNISV